MRVFQVFKMLSISSPCLFAGLALLSLLPGAAVAADQDAPAAGGPVSVLEGNSFWRVLYSWASPVTKTENGYQEIRRKIRGSCRCNAEDFRFVTVYPPGGWAEPDFDDSGWCRRHFFANYSNGEGDLRAGGGGASANLRQLTLRGKFSVTEPAKVGSLWLSMRYRGGVAVYLNGREVARDHLPAGKNSPQAAGRIEPGAPAELHPRKAYLKDNGELWNWWQDRQTIGKEAYPLRVRRLEKLALPTKWLRRGTNVLGLEIHAAAHPAECMKLGVSWATAGLIDLRLEADQAGGIVPNIRRPEGLQVWNTNIVAPLHSVEWGEPHERARPISLAGARNGSYSARAVVSSDTAIKGLRAKADALTGPKGATISASAVRVRYGAFDAPRGGAWGGTMPLGRILYPGMNALQDDALLERAPDEVGIGAKKMDPASLKARKAAGRPTTPGQGAVQPVWLTVRIPKDAAPGAYRGKLTITLDGAKPIELPVELKVIDWTLPDPADFEYFLGLIQCPDGVALNYGLRLWSNRHWELVGKSLEWIGQLGPKVLYVPLGAESQYGNSQSMVLWAKDNGGKFTHDFSRVEKYVDLALEKMGKPTFVVLGVWDSCDRAPQAFRRDFPRFSIVDVKTGKVSTADGPRHGTEESLRFWRPVLTGVRDILARRGLDKRILLGFGSDRLPPPAVVGVFRKILPEAGWQATRHHPTAAGALPYEGGQVPVKLHANVWGGWTNHDPDCRRVHGWKFPQVRTWLDRGLYDASPMAQYRISCEQALLSDRRGLGQIGADFWPVRIEGGKALSTIFGLRFPATRRTNLSMYVGQLLYPGPNGPVATARYEMFRENIQECEARIFLERLLTEKPCRLRAELAKKCQHVLDERTRWHRMQRVGIEAGLSWPYSGWEARTTKLYEVAAEALSELRQAGAQTAVGK